MWGLSLVWPVANAALTPRVADAIVVGLVVAVSAYFLGRQPFTENRQTGEKVHSTPADRNPTRPSAPIIFPFSRTPRSTRPIPNLVAPNLHARATQPIPVVVRQERAARITKPIPQMGR
jgi:hypothetical protein